MTETENIALDSEQIQALIPHRAPFLMVDKVVEFVDGDRIVGIKNVSINEPFFGGHFPSHPIMPGVLILESMAQTAAIFAKKCSNGIPAEKYIYLVGASDCRWKKMVRPGDTLRIQMKNYRKKSSILFMDGEVFVDGKLVATATIAAAESD